MNKFSEAHTAAKAAFDSGDLAGEFKNLQKALKRLVAGANGPDAAEAGQASNVRKAVAAAAKKLVQAGNPQAQSNAKAIVEGAGDGPELHQRAAALKMIKHLYLEKSSGGQQVWVYSPPVAYSSWIFDEVQGKSAVALQTVLAQDGDEVYSATQRSTMATAVQEARAVALAVVAKLGTPDAATKAVVRRYFGTSATSEAALATVMTTLLAGYKKIANACNGTNIIISDEPGDRTRNGGKGWKDWAFIYSQEAMSVIYLQGAWLKKADEITPSNASPLDRCVRTLIHELSHKQCRTEDIVYGPKGLKPEGSTALTAAYALHNADSWAYFAVDVLGRLTGPDRTNGETSTTAIRMTPTRELTV